MSTTSLPGHDVEPDGLPTPPASVFGRVHLGYLVIETQRMTDWRRFGVDAVGMHADELDRDTLRFRMDEHACRFLLERGPAEDVTTIGWQLDDHDTFDRVIDRVRGAGVPTAEGTAEQAARRGVERLLRFPGPKGITQEVFTRPVLDEAPPVMRTSRFVTGEGGMGHVALTSTNPAGLRGYYDTLFDARLSDYIDETISGVILKIRFLRVNERHHSIAVASTQGVRLDPIRTRVQHLNVQVAELDDMVGAYQRIKELGFGVALAVGQHTNDRELSFYAQTPSGFEWEVGWNPLVVDEKTWEPVTHRGISVWGHTPVGQTVIDKLNQFRLGLGSLIREEEVVLPLAGAGIEDYVREVAPSAGRAQPGRPGFTGLG
ncbi:VOC family protein [Actinomycetospora termitidis]|uniref:VOC family protein n=1 Tax=Actinomycetospora termitidis TaxID=3053470 RepID=A0ABT7MG60_9PSEU|nr:VOC family protein [Actinomycetospora sp. Odt1-22]MDL5159667.1 VOC family protein [Actinomycetospora sp. Odt1-22]